MPRQLHQVGALHSGAAIKTLKYFIDQEGIGGNLALCYDFAAEDTYPGSGQSIFDLTTGDIDSYLGATGSADGDEPTFNGSAGGLSSSECLSVDGGDFTRLISANPTAIENLHKNNADFTIMAIWYHKTVGANNVGIFGSDGGSAAKIGIRWWFAGAEKPRFTVSASGSFAIDAEATGTALTNNAWHIMFLSYDEASSSGFQVVNESSVHTISAAYSTPSASAASHKAELFASGNAALKALTGTRMAGFALWTESLTDAECDSLSAAINAERSYY